MNKKLLELLNSINEKKNEVKNLVNEGKMEEAKAAKNELQTMQDKFDILKDIDDEGIANMQQKAGNGTAKQVQPKDHIAEFANAARNGFRINNSMNEGTPADGGYTVPEDIQTKINEYRSAKASLIDLVDVEPVTVEKGSRTFKKRSQQTGFVKVGEGGKIPGKNTPQFERLDYEISKYAGYFPVTNELLEDSDQAIASVLITWIGDESRVTRNNIIRTAINTKAKVTLAGLDDIKKTINVTLGSAFKATSKIITNDDGLQYLDTLKDADGKYLLQPNPAGPMQLRLCAGATIIPVFVIPNGDMPSDVATAGKRKIPFIIGDLKEGVKFFDRKQLSILTSTIAQVGDLNAFEEDLTLYRAIEREDCRTKDTEAFVNGEIVIDDATVTVG
ncbi:phage major capsid protein [uncultured Robinsoniella sp.]|uniref:phage major capsid protein n=1 Tax=uncultured Robinsoniella sp. TaxID=904190 RepID=UPI0029124216|nr:phage major capsid protein [Clostridiales bacterium]